MRVARGGGLVGDVNSGTAAAVGVGESICSIREFGTYQTGGDKDPPSNIV